MENERKLLSGAMVTLALATATLVMLPHIQLSDVPPPEGLKPYTEQQLRGREVYISMGCDYCHSQHPRSQSQAPDVQRGWGRPSAGGDYYYESQHWPGSTRTRPRPVNLLPRQPS